MIEELSGLLGSSLVTARRRLRQWKAYTSYNQNGRYYVLPDIAKFDTDGLWRHQDILFSQHGNLKQTVIGAKKYAEGRGLSIDVQNDTIIGDIKTLIDIKINN